MNEHGAYYIIIPAPVRHHPKLSIMAKFLYGEISYKCNLYGYCWATNKTFSQIMQTTERSIQRFIKELEINKFIKISYENSDKGTQRKIAIIVAFGEGVTNLTPPWGDKINIPGGDKIDVAGGDKIDTHNINTKGNNKSRKNNTIIPPADKSASGSGEPIFTDETVPRKPKDQKRKETPPAGAPPPLEKQLHQPFIDAYHKWFMSRNGGVKPHIAGKDAKAVKTLIGSMAGAVKGAAEAKKEIIQEQDFPDHVLKGWQFLLQNWDKLTAFLQQQTDLCQISSNFNNIISIIKNGHGSGKIKPINGTNPANQADYVSRIATIVNERIAGQG